MTTTVASLQAIFTANTGQLDAAIGRVKSGLSGLGGSVGSSVASVGASMQTMGARIGLGIAPLVLLGRQGIRTATDFDSAMMEISARAGIVGDDLKQIEQYALEMGATTVFSANEAADGLLQLLTSGQSIEESMATLPSVMALAAAGNIGLGQSADLVTDIMAAYGLELDEAIMVTDALAQAAGASSADVNALGQGFSNVGPVADNMGLSVVQTAAALAILSENGIKGAEAGTALKSMLTNMVRPTEDVQGAWEQLGVSFYDAEGNARNIEVVLGELDAALDALPIEEQNELMYSLAGSYGIVALSALRGDVSITDMRESMDQQATAAEVAEARMDTFAGSMDELGGAVETLSIQALRPFMNETLRPLAGVATDMINTFAAWAAVNPEIIQGIGLLVLGLTALSTVMIVGGGLVSFLGVGIAALASPIGHVVVAVGALAAAFATDFGGIRTSIKQVGKDLREGDLDGALENIGKSLAAIPMGIATWIGDQVGIDVPEGIKSWETTIGNIKTTIDNLPQAIGLFVESVIGFEVPVVWQTMEAIVAALQGNLTPLADLVGGFINALSKLTVPDALNAIANTVSSIVDGLGKITGLSGGVDVDTITLGGAEASGGFGYTYPTDSRGVPTGGFVSAGGSAGGGTVMSGMARWVGETGPELFVPTTSGQILTSQQSSAAASTSQQVVISGGTFILQGVHDTQKLFDELKRIAQRRA